MANAKTIKVTNKRLVEIGEGLRTMAQRALPSRITEQRVAIYWARIRPVLEAYDVALKPLKKREEEALRLPEGDPQREADLAQIQMELEDFNAQAIEINKPRVKFTDADVPRALKTKDGTGLLNSSSAAMIRALLSPEFFALDDPDKDLKDDDDSSEPDTTDAREVGGGATDAREPVEPAE